MKIITLASRKGGTGKTTLSINLAAIANTKSRACVIDMDPQKSVLVWKRLREEQGLPKLPIGFRQPRDLQTTLNNLRKQKMRWVFIDTPPNVGEPVAAAMRSANLIVIPVRPDAQNLDAVMDTIVLARQFRKPYIIVVNEAPPIRNGVPSPLVQEARYEATAAGIRASHLGVLWKQQITHRNALPYAFNAGLALSERSDYSDAFNELNRLWIALNGYLERQK